MGAVLSELLFRCRVMGQGVLSKRRGCEADPTLLGGRARRVWWPGRGHRRIFSARCAGSCGLSRGQPLLSLCVLASNPADSSSGRRSTVPVTFRMGCDTTARSSFSCLNRCPRGAYSQSAGPSAEAGHALRTPGRRSRGPALRPASPSATCWGNDRQVRRPEECGLLPALRQVAHGRQRFALLTRPRDVARSPS